MVVKWSLVIVIHLDSEYTIEREDRNIQSMTIETKIEMCQLLSSLLLNHIKSDSPKRMVSIFMRFLRPFLAIFLPTTLKSLKN